MNCGRITFKFLLIYCNFYIVNKCNGSVLRKLNAGTIEGVH